MTTNEILIVLEAILALALIVLGLFKIKKIKGNINPDDLLAIIVDNKDLLISIINQLGDVKSNNVPTSVLKSTVVSGINSVLLDKDSPLTDFQKEIVKNNEDFFSGYLIDRLVTKETLAGQLEDRIEKNQ